MKELKGRYFFCKTTRLFSHLTESGSTFVKCVPDKLNHRFQVFLFLIDENLKNALDSYSLKIKNSCAKKPLSLEDNIL